MTHRYFCACGNPRDRRSVVCLECHNREIAPKGYRAVVDKYGEDYGKRKIQAYRLDHPSDLERLVATALQDLDIAFDREGWIVLEGGKIALVDFLLQNKRIIEVNGYWHKKTGERDAVKLSSLESCGFSVLVLTEAQVRSDLRPLLSAFVREEQNP